MNKPGSGLDALLFLLLALFLFDTELWAQNLRDPEFMVQARQGFNFIHNLDYDQGERVFETLKSEYPEHPAPPLHLAVTTWLRELFERQEMDLDRFIAPGYFAEPSDRTMSARERQAFFDNIATCEKLARAILEEAPGNKDARYFLGIAQGILGSFAFTIDRSKRSAFDHGKKVYRYHKDLLEEDPEYYDAYMSVGLYEYIVGNLPWYIKWLAAIVGYHGNEERGLQYLSLAAQKGEYISTDAQVLQMVLFVREKRFEEALATVRFLHQKYPHNYLLHLNQAQILERLNENDEAGREYQEVLQLAEAGKPNYQKLPLTVFYYDLGAKLMKLNQNESALAQFQKAIAHSETPERQRALSYLRTAQIYHSRGRRSEAKAHCERVLHFREFDNSHDEAKDLLEKLRITNDE